MSKINELIQISTRTVTKISIIPATYDGHGAELTPAREETYTVEAPVMGTVTREMTAEEAAAFLAAQADAPAPEPSPEEQIAALQQQIALLLSGEVE